jgi:MFS family permease
MRVAGADTAAATGVLNTGGNIGGIIVQPVVGALSGSGHWQAAFVSGAVFALLAALCWLRVNCEKPASSALASVI